MILSNVALLMLIFFLIYKPAMEKLNDENKFIIDQFAITVDKEITEKAIFVDLYIFNQSEQKYFDFSRISCTIEFTDGSKLYPLNVKNENTLINQNTGIHYILSFEKNMQNWSSNFFIRINYDNKTVYESKTFNIKDQK